MQVHIGRPQFLAKQLHRQIEKAPRKKATWQCSALRLAFGHEGVRHGFQTEAIKQGVVQTSIETGSYHGVVCDGTLAAQEALPALPAVVAASPSEEPLALTDTLHEDNCTVGDMFSDCI